MCCQVTIVILLYGLAGNELVHQLTSQSSYELRIDMTDKVAATTWVKYSTFKLLDEASKYQIDLGSFTASTGSKYMCSLYVEW